MSSKYSPARAQMIMCPTRRMDCTPNMCLKCGWLREETRESLNKEQELWQVKESNETKRPED